MNAPMDYPILLAQARGTSSDIGAQLNAFLDLAFTPAGFALGVLGAATLVVLLFSRGGTQLVAAGALFLLSMMRTESKWADNTLVQPLETIRSFSRPLAFALLVIIAVRSLAFPRGERTRLLVVPAVLFLAYELYYVTLVGAFIDPTRGAFGVLCYFAALAAFVFGLPKVMQGPGESRGLLGIFAITGLLFIGANFFQLALGYSNAVIQGRLTGISGNPQQFALSCCIFLLVGCYFFSISRAGSWVKWFAAISMGILGLFVLWSGSRTGALCSAVIVLAYFRTKLGRLALLGIVGGGAFAVAVSMFGESLEIVERFLEGGDTRTEVWRAALADFASSPVFGILPFVSDDNLNFTESTYLRTLALMGSIGGLLLLAVMFSWCRTAFAVWRLSRTVPAIEAEADFVVASTAFFVVANVGEGLMMGVLTIFIPLIYATFAMAAYVLDVGPAQAAFETESTEFGDDDGLEVASEPLNAPGPVDASRPRDLDPTVGGRDLPPTGTRPGQALA
jgi:hypothetical protein